MLVGLASFSRGESQEMDLNPDMTTTLEIRPARPVAHAHVPRASPPSRPAVADIAVQIVGVANEARPPRARPPTLVRARRRHRPPNSHRHPHLGATRKPPGPAKGPGGFSCVQARRSAASIRADVCSPNAAASR